MTHFWWQELRRIVRFGIFGFVTWLFYLGLYTALSRVIWPTGNRTVENFLAIVLASVFNFFAHRHWTFASAHPPMQQVRRYVLVIGSAALLDAFLFWVGHEVLHLYDLVVAFLASGVLAGYTYILHRFYTFHHRTLEWPKAK